MANLPRLRINSTNSAKALQNSTNSANTLQNFEYITCVMCLMIFARADNDKMRTANEPYSLKMNIIVILYSCFWCTGDLSTDCSRSKKFTNVNAFYLSFVVVCCTVMLSLPTMGLIHNLLKWVPSSHPHCKCLYWYQEFLCPVEPLYLTDEKSTTVEKW